MQQLFFPIRGLESPLMKVQDAIDLAFRKLFKLSPIMDGVLLESVTLSATETDVEHGLGRAPRGFIVVDSNAAVTVYRSGTTSFPDMYIRLSATGSAVVSLWVF